MKKIALTAIAAFFAAAPFITAHAVDVVNQDDQEHLVFFGTDDDSKEASIAPGETLAGLCEACSIQINDEEPVIAEGAQVVVIKDGKASLGM